MLESIKLEVQTVFRKVFLNQSIILSENITADDIEGWDSLTHLELISELENHFKLHFTFQEVMSFENVGQMIHCIGEKIKLKKLNGV